MRGRYLQTDWLCARFSRLTKRHTPQIQDISVKGLVTDEWWFGYEQEYFFTNPEDGTILGWEDGTPRPQGDYYCGVGAGNVIGREISETHMDVCLAAGIMIAGTNAEVALGQWEYQCFGKGLRAGDDLWASRYLLQLVAEDYGVAVNYHPKPQEGDWNGSGMHTNFSNDEMRNNSSEALMNSLCESLGEVHSEGIAEYGSDNDKRLTGLHETQSIDTFSYAVSDRGASIRIPIYTVDHNWNGYSRRQEASLKRRPLQDHGSHSGHLNRLRRGQDKTTTQGSC